MDTKEIYTKLVETFKIDATYIVEDAVKRIHSDLLPYVENDTEMNVAIYSQKIIESLLSGDFERVDDGSVRVRSSTGASMLLYITDLEYDMIRDNLIRALPKCPKDLKIKALEEALELERSLSKRW